MRFRYALASGVLVFIIVNPALATPTIVRELGTAPLLGPSDTGSEELGKILAREARVRRAALDLGLTSGQFDAFMRQWRLHEMRWVTIPRHLDAMSWAAGDHVHVIRDVYVPPKTKGWEVDIQGHGRTISLFMPAACGNLSVLRRPKRVVEAPRPKPVPTPPAPTPAPTETPAPALAPPAPAPEASPQVAAASVPPPTHHAHPLWPYLIPLLIHTHHVSPPPGPPPPLPPGFFSAG